MTIQLLRHAHAVSRSAWSDGSDRDRPLSAKGLRQSEDLTSSLVVAEPKRLFSSPALRCRQTLEPLSSKLGLEIETCEVLFEGSDPTATIALILEHADDNPVISTHGDIIPEVIGLLIGRGMTIDGPTGNKKASRWALEMEDGHVVAGTYHNPK